MGTVKTTIGSPIQFATGLTPVGLPVIHHSAIKVRQQGHDDEKVKQRRQPRLDTKIQDAEFQHIQDGKQRNDMKDDAGSLLAAPRTATITIRPKRSAIVN